MTRWQSAYRLHLRKVQKNRTICTMDDENLTPPELDNSEDEASASLDDELYAAEDTPEVAEEALEPSSLEAKAPDLVLEASDELAAAESFDEPIADTEISEEEAPVEEEATVEEATVEEATVEEATVEEALVEEPLAEEPLAEEPLAEEFTGDDASDEEDHSEWAPSEDDAQVEPLAEPEPVDSRDFSSVDDFDVSAALAAVASLDQLTSDETDEDFGPDEEYDFAEQGEYVPVDEYDYTESLPVPAADADYISAGYSQGATIAYPEIFSLRRGQIASVVPALLLIGLGAWLTFITTTADETAPQIDPMLVMIALVGVLSIGLLSHWWTTHRWARGSFFLSMTLLAVGAVAFYLVQPGDISLANGWPLLIGGVGVALVLTGLLTQPRSGAMAAFGVMVALLSGAATAVTAALLPADVLSLAADAWPVAAVIAVLLLLVPVIRR